MTADIRHIVDGHRFSTTVDGVEAWLEYRPGDGEITITHTWVPKQIGGRGIAGDLVRAAFEHARAASLKVKPVCTYSAAWLERHPEYADLRA